ncbi:enoyl-CoA hydratase/isomerase family protein [Streptomyces sp. NPDC014734]|uniref:enoyl-CoA hydratase/isomerase family protein n=1 Tax=Streptomyces sp. NPDC014734 TaxID=3364886 RepID=UPI0036F52B2B
MSYSGYKSLVVRAEDRIARATIDNPPVNTVDATLAGDLKAFAGEVAFDENITVIVLQSANPEFFSAHADFEWSFDPSSLMVLADPDPGAAPALNPLQQLNERLRTLSQVTIAKVRGYARAGGAELAMAADMRFADRSPGVRFVRSGSVLRRACARASHAGRCPPDQEPLRQPEVGRCPGAGVEPGESGDRSLDRLPLALQHRELLLPPRHRRRP